MVTRTCLLLIGCGALLLAGDILYLCNVPLNPTRWAQFREEAGIGAQQPGFTCRTYTDKDGTLHRYAVFVPYHIPAGTRPPLILFLNGYGKNGSDGLGPLRDGIAAPIWERRFEFPFVVVFPQCPEGSHWEPGTPTARIAFELLDRIAAQCQTDPNRVYLTGISSGGAGTWELAAAHPERFAAVVPMSSPPRNLQIADKIAAARLPVWSYYVDADDPPLVDFNRKIHHRLLKLGGTSHATEISVPTGRKEGVHNSWDYAYRNAALYRWLLGQTQADNSLSTPRWQLIENFAPKNTPPAADPSGWSTANAGLNFSGEGPGRHLLTSIPSWTDLELEIEFRRETGPGWTLWLTTTDHTGGFGLNLQAVDRPSGLVTWPRQQPLQSALPVLAGALREEEWNTLRLVVQQNRVSAELNGWPVLSPTAVAMDPSPVEIGLAVNSGPETAAGPTRLHWRNLRFRIMKGQSE